MAFFEDNEAVEKITNEEFRKTYSPGVSAPWSGIYHCTVCNHEIVSTYGNKLPPQNHHQHPQGGAIKWKLIVIPKHNQKS